MAVMEEPHPLGLFSSVRRLCESVLTVLHNRVELFAVELQEEKSRAIELLIFAMCGVFLGVIAVVVVTFTIAFLLEGDARRIALIIFSALYVLGSAGFFLAVRSLLKNRPPPFSATIAELKKDRSCLQK
jgi:uncharacterized membrane protein YqjE